MYTGDEHLNPNGVNQALTTNKYPFSSPQQPFQHPISSDAGSVTSQKNLQDNHDKASKLSYGHCLKTFVGRSLATIVGGVFYTVGVGASSVPTTIAKVLQKFQNKDHYEAGEKKDHCVIISVGSKALERLLLSNPIAMIPRAALGTLAVLGAWGLSVGLGEGAFDKNLNPLSDTEGEPEKDTSYSLRNALDDVLGDLKKSGFGYEVSVNEDQIHTGYARWQPFKSTSCFYFDLGFANDDTLKRTQSPEEHTSSGTLTEKGEAIKLRNKTIDGIVQDKYVAIINTFKIGNEKTFTVESLRDLYLELAARNQAGKDMKKDKKEPIVTDRGTLSTDINAKTLIYQTRNDKVKELLKGHSNILPSVLKNTIKQKCKEENLNFNEYWPICRDLTRAMNDFSIFNKINSDETYNTSLLDKSIGLYPVSLLSYDE